MDHEDYYRRIRRQVRDWAAGRGADHRYAEYVLLAPDLVHLLVRMTLDDRVDARAKAKLGVALAYFVSPVDLLPEAILGPIGLTDDVAVACLALHAVLADERHRAIAREHWQGDEELLVTIQRVLDIGREMLGGGVWRKVQQRFGRR